MNCPGAITSFNELFRNISLNPSNITKYAEIGLVHRAERRAQLHGLLRVRAFHQDDAHIFLPIDDAVIRNQILEILEMMDTVYGVFGLSYSLELSTRPDDRIGSDELWDLSEGALKNALEATGLPWKINPGDGAFYGAKIDVHVKDRMGRSWQCGTIQVDFNLPERFDVKLRDGTRPVMLHRVIFGSIERFIGILLEHFKGKLPLWIAPEHVRLLPVADRFNDAAIIIENRLKEHGFRVKTDLRRESIRKKVKVATLAKVPYTIVIGEKEIAGEDWSVKVLGKEDNLTIPEAYFIRYLKKKIESKAIDY